MACATVVANSANLKGFRVLVNPREKIWMCFINHHDNTGRKQHVLPGMPLPNTLESSQTQITLVENLNCMVANQGTVEHLICGCSCVAGRWASYLTGVVSISKKCHLFLLFV